MTREDEYQLELLCLDWDVAIDEEAYKVQNVSITFRVANREVEDFTFQDGEHRKVNLKDLSGLTSATINFEGKDPIPLEAGLGSNEYYWRYLIAAKQARAKIQENGSTESMAQADQIAEFLLKHLPDESITLLSKESITLFRILYLNEIAACYRGFLSIGYADLCLDLIKKEELRDKTAYELIALYNKGHGYFHARDRENACQQFEKIIEEEDNPQPNYYIESTPIVRGKFMKTDRWQIGRVAFIPARLMKAECLLKMQRAYEAERVCNRLLKRRGKGLSKYQRFRAWVLKCRAKIDKGEINGLHREIANLKSCVHPYPWGNLQNQIFALEVEAYQRQAEASLLEKSRNALHEATQYFRHYPTLRDLFNGQEHNTIDATQTVLLWSKGFRVIELWCQAVRELRENSKVWDRKWKRVCEDTFLLVKDYLEVNGQAQKFLRAVKEVLIDTSFRPNKSEIRKSFLDRLPKLEKALNGIEFLEPTNIRDIVEHLRDLEIDVLRKLKGSLNLTEVVKHKYKQREDLLNRKPLLSKKRAKLLRFFLAKQFFAPDKDQKEPEECLRGCSYECTSRKCREIFVKRTETNAGCIKREKEDKTKIEHFYDVRTDENRQKLLEVLHAKTHHNIQNGVGLAILRRWNSFSPALLPSSKGGGYFLYKTDNDGKIEYGIAIDPGYDFLRNFFAEGFGINDINAVLVSHDHPDHLDDFEAIVNLKYESLEKNRGGLALNTGVNLKLKAVMSQGCFEKLRYIIDRSNPVFQDTFVIRPPYRRGGTTRKVIDEDDQVQLNCFTIKATKALHQDVSVECDSIGFIIEVQGKLRIGFTCDTRWDKRVFWQYRGCDILCYHAGSITPDKKRLCDHFDPEELDQMVFGNAHLYLPGTLMFSLLGKSTQIRVISEFGEELKGGLRIDFTNKLQTFCSEFIQKPAIIVPSDTGLVINVLEKKLSCKYCKNFFHPSFIKFEALEPDEQIVCVCSNCSDLLSKKYISQ